MYAKKLLSLVSLLLACGLKSASAAGVVIQTCDEAGITVATSCAGTDDEVDATGICLKDNVIYSYAESKTGCYQAKLVQDLADIFHVIRIGATTAGREGTFTGEISNPEELAILKCDNGECKQAYGIIKSGTNYYKITKSGSSSLPPTEVANADTTGCTGSDIGKLLRSTSAETDPVYLCLAAGITAKLPVEDTENKNYLLIGKDGVDNGSAFKSVNLGGNDNGIVIIGKNADATVGSETPSMLVFDPTYTVINDCLVEEDLSISSRKDNLCAAGVNCDKYYFCHSGICTESTTVAPDNKEIREETCTAPTSTTESDYVKCKGIETVGGKFYNCPVTEACTELTEIGYFLNLYAQAENKYIKCSGSPLSCQEYEVTHSTCDAAGELYDAAAIKLCLDTTGTVNLLLDSTNATPINYFVSVNTGNMFGDKTGHYISVTVEAGEVKLTSDMGAGLGKWYKYADADNRIYTKAEAITGITVNGVEQDPICNAKGSIVEFSIEADEATHTNKDSKYYKKVVA